MSSLSPDGRTIYFIAGERGRHNVYKVPVGGGAPQRVLNNVFATNLEITSDGRTLVFANSTLAAPPEVYRANVDGSGLTSVTRVNADLLARADMKPAEEMEWTGALNHKVHGFLLKPRNFDAIEALSIARPDSRRAAGRLERYLELSLESANLCRRRLRGVHAEPARLDHLRPAIHQRDQRRLGRQSLHRSEEWYC